MHCGVHLIYLLWLLFWTAKVSTSYGELNVSFINQRYIDISEQLNIPKLPWEYPDPPNHYRRQRNIKYPNNGSYVNDTHQNSYHNIFTNKPLTWNGTDRQWQPSLAQINRSGEHWNSTSGQNIDARFGRAAYQKVSESSIFLRRITRHIYNYGSQNTSLYPNYQNQPQTLNTPGQQWNSSPNQYRQQTSLYPNYQNQPQTLNNPGQPWNSSPNQYRQQTNQRYPNNVSYANNTQHNSYHNIYTNKPLTWNGTGPQWQPTAAPLTNMYLKSQTPSPGLGPGLVYYSVPPNQQHQINRSDNRWNSTLNQNIHARFGRAAHQSRHQNLSWYNIHPNWYNNKPPAWNGTVPSWNQPGGQYFQWNMTNMYQNWYNNKPPAWNCTGLGWNKRGGHQFQWNMTDPNNSTYFGPCRDNPPGHHHNHRHRHHEHHHHKDSQPPPPPEVGPPPHGALPHFGPPPPPQFGPPNFNRPPPGWYPFSYCNNTLPESNGTITPGTNPSDTEVGTGTTFSSTEENEVAGNSLELPVSSTSEKGNDTNLWGFEVRDLNGSNETDGNSTPQPE